LVRQKAGRGEMHGQHGEQRVGGGAVDEVGGKRARGDGGVGGQIERANVAKRVGRGHGTIERVVNDGVRVWRGERDGDGRKIIAARGRDGGRRERGRAGETIDPRGNHGDGVGINEIAEVGHLNFIVRRVDTRQQHGTPRILGLEHAGVVHAQRERRGKIGEVLVGEWRVVARVERGAGPAGLMTLHAVGFQVRARPFFERGAQIGERGELEIIGDAGFVDGGIKQTKIIQRAELVVGHAGGGIIQRAVQLARVDAEHIIRDGRVTCQTIRRTRINPNLGADASGVGDENGFVQSAGQQIGIAVVRAPFVSDAIDAAVDVAHEQTGFKAARRDGGVGFVHDEIKVFHEDGAGGKRPIVIRGEIDLFVRRDEPAVIRQCKVARFQRCVRPQRGVRAVRNDAARGRARGGVGKHAAAGKQRGQRAAARGGHIGERGEITIRGEAVRLSAAGADGYVGDGRRAGESAAVQRDGGKRVTARAKSGGGEKIRRCVSAVAQRAQQRSVRIKTHGADLVRGRVGIRAQRDAGGRGVSRAKRGRSQHDVRRRIGERIQLRLRNRAGRSGGAAPLQLHGGVVGVLKIIQPHVVELLRIERDGGVVRRSVGARRPIVDEQLAVDPQPHAIVRDGRNGVSLAVLRLHASGPARGEIGLADDCARRGVAPIEIHHGVGAGQCGGGGETYI